MTGSGRDFRQIKSFDDDPATGLLLAASRSGVDQAAIRGLASRIEDWDFFTALAARHGLRTLVFHALETSGASCPAAVTAQLWAAHARRERVNALLLAELQRVVAALEERSIACIPFKGPTLALLAYGNLAAREFGDLDVLVRPGEVEAARRVLEALGYRSELGISPAAEREMLRARAHNHLGMHAPSGVLVELHWRSDPDFPVERDDDRWWSSLPRREFGSARMRSFEPTDLMLVLLLHGSKHHWSSLHWLVDVAELARREAIDWEHLQERARSLGASRRVQLGLALASDLLDAPVPAVHVHPAIARLSAELAREAIAAEAAIGARRLLARNLALLDRRRDRMRVALQVIFAPTIADWTRWKLPRPLFFLYVPLRLARLAAKHARIMMPRRHSGTAAMPRTPPRPPRSTG